MLLRPQVVHPWVKNRLRLSVTVRVAIDRLRLELDSGILLNFRVLASIQISFCKVMLNHAWAGIRLC